MNRMKEVARLLRRVHRVSELDARLTFSQETRMAEKLIEHFCMLTQPFSWTKRAVKRLRSVHENRWESMSILKNRLRSALWWARMRPAIPNGAILWGSPTLLGSLIVSPDNVRVRDIDRGCALSADTPRRAIGIADCWVQVSTLRGWKGRAIYAMRDSIKFREGILLRFVARSRCTGGSLLDLAKGRHTAMWRLRFAAFSDIMRAGSGFPPFSQILSLSDDAGWHPERGVGEQWSGFVLYATPTKISRARQRAESRWALEDQNAIKTSHEVFCGFCRRRETLPEKEYERGIAERARALEL